MRRVAEGFTNSQIAEELRLGVKSVETYRSRVMEKLGLTSRSALVRFALDCGVLAPGDTSPMKQGSPRACATTTMPFEERLTILKELMRALDLVTLAGREHLMNKMLLLLRGEILGLESPIAEVDVLSLSNAMTELEHEACRFAPTPGTFNGHVETAICALRRAAIGAGAMVYGAELVLPSDASI